MNDVKTTIYLDNAATSWPKPACVVEAMGRFLAEDAGAPNRAGHRMAMAAARVVTGVRTKLAKLFGAPDPNRIVLGYNCTDALNMAIKGSLRESDHVITTVLEHNSISRPLEAMARAGHIELTRLPATASGVVDPEAFRHAITPRTRLIATVHASNVTGVIQPIEAIGRIAREHDVLLLVDAAQSAGLLPIDVESMHIDMLAFPGHKCLLGPTGTAGLLVGARATLKPWREGGTGNDSVYPTQPEEFPTWMEAGTPNAVGLAGLSAALDQLDPAQALRHEQTLIDHFVSAVTSNDGIDLHGDPTATRSVAVMSLTVRNVAPEDVAAILDTSFGTAVRPGLHCAPYHHQTLGTFPNGTVRLSPGSTTTTTDLDKVIAALVEISQGASISV